MRTALIKPYSLKQEPGYYRLVLSDDNNEIHQCVCCSITRAAVIAENWLDDGTILSLANVTKP